MRRVAELASASVPRALALVLVCAVVLAGGYLWLAHQDDGGAQPGEQTPLSGWKTIEYQGVQVDVPASWQRVETDACRFRRAVWAPKESAGCEWAGGIVFYNAAGFDPAYGPGVRRASSQNEPEWGGYTYAANFAVYSSDDARETVRNVLQSVQ